MERWREREERRESGDLGFLCALPDLVVPPRRNKSRKRQKAPVPDLVAFHPRSSHSLPALLWQQGKKSQEGQKKREGEKKKKKKRPTGNEEDRSVFLARSRRAETRCCQARSINNTLCPRKSLKEGDRSLFLRRRARARACLRGGRGGASAAAPRRLAGFPARRPRVPKVPRSPCACVGKVRVCASASNKSAPRFIYLS